MYTCMQANTRTGRQANRGDRQMEDKNRRSKVKEWPEYKPEGKDGKESR